MKNHIVLSLRELLQNGYDENKIIDSFKGFKKIRDSLNEDGLFELYKKLNFE